MPTTPDNHERGRFEGEVLARLQALREGQEVLFEKLKERDAICHIHGVTLARHQERFDATDHVIARIYWMVGGLIAGLVVLAGNILYVALK